LISTPRPWACGHSCKTDRRRHPVPVPRSRTSVLGGITNLITASIKVSESGLGSRVFLLILKSDFQKDLMPSMRDTGSCFSRLSAYLFKVVSSDLEINLFESNNKFSLDIPSTHCIKIRASASNDSIPADRNLFFIPDNTS